MGKQLFELTNNQAIEVVVALRRAIHFSQFDAGCADVLQSVVDVLLADAAITIEPGDVAMVLPVGFVDILREVSSGSYSESMKKIHQASIFGGEPEVKIYRAHDHG